MEVAAPVRPTGSRYGLDSQFPRGKSGWGVKSPLGNGQSLEVGGPERARIVASVKREVLTGL